jgi:hypothetical protein
MNFVKKTLFALVFVASFGHSTSAQVVPIETVDGYKIARIVSADICFAVTDLRSAQNYDMVFSYYHAKSGQRWQVGGYLSSLDHPEATDTLIITIDGDLKLTRDIELSDGDFMVPFESLQELQAFERNIETASTLEFGLNKDSFEIDLEKYRVAIQATLDCVGDI